MTPNHSRSFYAAHCLPGEPACISGPYQCPCSARRYGLLWERFGIVEDKRFEVLLYSTTKNSRYVLLEASTLKNLGLFCCPFFVCQYQIANSTLFTNPTDHSPSSIFASTSFSALSERIRLSTKYPPASVYLRYARPHILHVDTMQRL